MVGVPIDATALLHFQHLLFSIFFHSWRNGGDGDVRERRQENEEREAVQGIVRKRQAEEGKKDRAHQRSCGGAEVYPLASPLQAHIEGFRKEVQSGLIGVMNVGLHTILVTSPRLLACNIVSLQFVDILIGK